MCRSAHSLDQLARVVLAASLAACGETAPTTDAATSPDARPRPDDAALSDAFDLPPPEVTIAGLGAVRGVREQGAQSFYAIPYAEPPIGALRWQSPVARGPWEGVLDASAPSPACTQLALSFGALGQEDCLYLNVHRPDASPMNAPVMVWIHGGAFVFGEGLQTDRGTRGDLIAAAHGALVVSMNYRLGPFGFFVNEATGANGNAGFEDQILALEWVRDHIADFGGNPDDVTIVGESAGGLSVCLHLVAPRSRGLFQRAISQSGLCDTTLSLEADRLGVANGLVAALGCDTAPDQATCLRSASAEAVRDASGLDGVFSTLTARVRPWWPYVDGSILPEQFRDAATRGRTGEVPVIVGWNRDEGTLFVDLAERSGATADEAAYHDLAGSLAAASGLELSAVESRYPLSAYPDPGAAIAAMLGHQALACPSRRAARLLAEHGHPTYVYRFEYPDAAFQLVERTERELGAFHFSEIQFVFGRAARLGRPRFNADEAELSAAMQGAWLRFVTTGEPGGEAQPWPAYEPEDDRHLVFDRATRLDDGADAEVCAFWASAT
jgi:para-nitrobenzyl esterase